MFSAMTKSMDFADDSAARFDRLRRKTSNPRKITCKQRKNAYKPRLGASQIQGTLTPFYRA